MVPWGLVQAWLLFLSLSCNSNWVLMRHGINVCWFPFEKVRLFWNTAQVIGEVWFLYKVLHQRQFWISVFFCFEFVFYNRTVGLCQVPGFMPIAKVILLLNALGVYYSRRYSWSKITSCLHLKIIFLKFLKTI